MAWHMLTPDMVAHVDQSMASADEELDRLLHVYTAGAEKSGDAQSVLDLGKFLIVDYQHDVVAALCAMAIRRIARSS